MDPARVEVWRQRFANMLSEPAIPQLKAALGYACEFYRGVKLAYARGFLLEDFVGLTLQPILDGRLDLNRDTWRNTEIGTDRLSFRFDHVIRSARTPEEPRVIIECKTWLDANWLLSTLCKFHLLRPYLPNCKFHLVSLADESGACRHDSSMNMTARLLRDPQLVTWSDGVYFIDENEGGRLSDFLVDIQSSLAVESVR